ncbi:MAG TPA: Hint domain-containing protein [Rhodobacterales bacterium]|nr:Hint domain-containing protein [Rhodobacterales bacterium]
MPVRHLPVYRADQFRVVHGVNEGEPLADARDLVMEDIYQLAEASAPVRLGLGAEDESGAFHIAGESAVGVAGAPVYLDSLLTFMDASGETHEVLLFVEVDAADGTVHEVYAYPLAPLAPKVGYNLITIDPGKARARLAATASVAFTRGTHITMADGRQVKIEDLRLGDRVLTRDSGPQEVRWTGTQTLRASGPFAPITIEAGALNNTGTLVVSPNHRLFIYQRIDALKAGRKEILVKAGLLVNGTTVTQEPGGFVDYLQVLFDKHEIIYAEGIAAESLFVDPTTQPVLPGDVAQRMHNSADTPTLPGHELHPRDLASRGNAAALLKRISAL